MARLKLYHDTRTTTQDGKSQIKISLSHKGATALFPTDVLIRQEHWFAGDKDTDPYIKKTCTGYKVLNTLINDKFDRINDELLILQRMGEINSFKNATQLKQYIQDKIQGTGIVTFTDYFVTFIEKLGKKSTRQLYENTYKKVVAFSGGKQVRFEDITTDWLDDFERHMKELAVNTRALNMRNIRAVINSAINNEATDIRYPFRNFKIKRQETAKRSLSIEDLKRLRDYDCTDQPHMRQYIDIFMLNFYLIGINMIDLCNLTNTVDGRIEYFRNKTGRFYSVKLEPEALEIIERYRGKKYLIDILDRNKNYHNYLSRIDRSLKLIGPVTIEKNKRGQQCKKEHHPIFPKLSTYWARHTWATIAGKLDIPKETIAASLGHGQKTITDVYIDFDQTKVDEANRKVLDAIKG